MRPDLHPPPVTDVAARDMLAFHADVVARVTATIAAHPLVVVGMAWNQPVRSVRRALEEAGLRYEYLELGNYASQWRERLAVKIWSGWPTFPQVYVHGTLLGGDDRTREALADGSLRRRLDEAAPSPAATGPARSSR